MSAKPDFLEDFELEECLNYLDNLRESGVTNMFGATSYLYQELSTHFDTKKQAGQVLAYWMKTFSERHS